MFGKTHDGQARSVDRETRACTYVMIYLAVRYNGGVDAKHEEDEARAPVESSR